MEGDPEQAQLLVAHCGSCLPEQRLLYLAHLVAYLFSGELPRIKGMDF